MELEKYARQKGKQPKRSSVQRQTKELKSASKEKDEYEDVRKSSPMLNQRKILVPVDDDDFVDLGREEQ
jgi:hypothetical protein